MTAVGGITMGADPIACAALAGGADVKAFFVRKERKEHGLARWIEGPPLDPGERCLVLEDVVTTGGSTIKAIERVREAGHEVAGVLAILDRLAGGGEAIAEAARRALPCAHDDRRRVPGAPRPLVDEAARSDALARLEPFVGEWSLEAVSRVRSARRLAGSVVFEWDLGGKYLTQRTLVPHPAAPDSLAIVSVSPDGRAYTQHYFDSRGVTRLYAMTLDDGGWELLRESADFSPLPFSQRFIGTFSDDAADDHRALGESTEGSGWELDFELIYRRVG